MVLVIVVEVSCMADIESVRNYIRSPDHTIKKWCTICGSDTWFTDYQECKKHVSEEHFSSSNSYEQKRLTEVMKVGR